MKKLVPTPRWQVLVLAFALIALGVSGLALTTTSTASPLAAPAAGPDPGPLCGPTYQWSCVVPGCPSCPEYYFVGTLCEKNEYEKRTGQVCTPF